VVQRLNRDMEKQEMLSEIIRIEMIITEAVFKGHKASTDDEYQHLRIRAKEFRKKLGLI
jgi:hypothetical protein